MKKFVLHSCLYLSLLILNGCSETEQEQAQRDQYQLQMQQQIIETSPAFQLGLRNLLDSYFDLKNRLVESDPDGASAVTPDLIERSGTPIMEIA